MAFSPQMDAFRVSTRAMGIDLMRSVYTRNLGTYVASVGTTFRAGMLVQLNAAQEIEICGNGGATNPFGFAKYNKTNTLWAAVVGEQIQLVGVLPTNLAHANIWSAAGGVGGVRVFNLSTGAAYLEGALNDYTVVYINGQIQRTAGSTIPAGAYVGVTYQYEVTQSEMKFEGRNFWNFTDDVSIQDNKITVINDWSLIFTTQYDASRTYAVNDALYAGDSANLLQGFVTDDAVLGTPYIGRVFQLPTASDPFMGVQYAGGRTAP